MSFLEVLDALTDIPLLGAWAYRGALYVCYAPYRFETHARWRKESGLRVAVDVVGSLVVFLAELAVLVCIVYAIFR